MNEASESLSLNGAAGQSASRPDVYAAMEAEKPKPRRGKAHPDFVPKDELRRQLEAANERAAKYLVVGSTFAACAFALLILLIAQVAK